MVATVGSMAVMGKFNAGGVLSGFKNIIGNMKQTGIESKNLNTELRNVTESMTTMSKFSPSGILSDFKNITSKIKQVGIESKNLNTDIPTTGKFTTSGVLSGFKNITGKIKQAGAESKNLTGLMATIGKFNVSKISSGFKNIIGKMKQTGMESKNLKTAMGRMTGSMTAMAAAAGVTGAALLAMLVRAVMASPLLAGSLAKLRMAFMLFGMTISKHVKPIIEWVIKGVKWLHEKFKALPESMQGAMVKFVIIGGVILGFLSILITLIITLSAVKTAFIAIGGAAVLSSLAGTAAGAAAITAGILALATAVGIVVGIFGVWILLKTGILDFFSNLGEGFRNATGSAAVLRDMLMMVVGYFGAIGMAAIDIAKGDFGLSGFKAAMEEMKNVKHRLWTGEGYEGETSTSINLPASINKPDSKTQTTITNIDFNGANFEVPEGPDTLKDLIQQIEELKAQDLQTRQV